jgi:Mlc titration factor MtfA (ptsG expression regulator)
MRRNRSGSHNASLPTEWRDLLARRLTWWPLPAAEQHAVLEELVMAFLASKRFEAARGFTVSDDIRVTIAADACLLIVGLDLGWYRDVTTVIVSPSVAVRSGKRRLGGGIESEGPMSLAGEAMLHGPVMIAWDQAVGAARHPERGRNVVFHEFAHKLDMADGDANGVPRLPDRDAYHRWERAMGSALADLREGLPRFIDSYGATGPSELFAVATEAFFDIPKEQREREPEIYSLLSAFYRQDPASW